MRGAYTHSRGSHRTRTSVHRSRRSAYGSSFRAACLFDHGVSLPGHGPVVYFNIPRVNRSLPVTSKQMRVHDAGNLAIAAIAFRALRSRACLLSSRPLPPSPLRSPSAPPLVVGDVMRRFLERRRIDEGTGLTPPARGLVYRHTAVSPLTVVSRLPTFLPTPNPPLPESCLRHLCGITTPGPRVIPAR